MKEKQIKMNLIVNSVTIVLLATILFICTAFAWYVTNKTVSANGIGGASAVGNLSVLQTSIYSGTLDDNGNVVPPEDNASAIGGLLSGDKVYYGVTLKSSNDIAKNLTISIVGIDGGQWFTKPAIEITEDTYNAIVAGTLEGTTLLKEKAYKYSRIKKDTNGDIVKENDKPVYDIIDANSYIDNNGEFYISIIDDTYFKNYIYETSETDSNGNTVIRRYNMLDVYTIQLHTIYLKETDSSNSQVIDLETAVNNGNIKTDDREIKKFDSEPLSTTISNMDIMKYLNWDPKDHHEITIIFEIHFNIPTELSLAISNGLLSMNSMSRASISFDGMVILGEDISSNEEVSS